MMKQFVKNNQVLTEGTGSILVGGVKVENPSAEILLNNGWVEFIDDIPQPSAEDAKQASIESINQEVDNRILNGFSYNEMKVLLNSENRQNYESAFNLSAIKEQQGKEFKPITFLFVNGTHTFETFEELQKFHESAFDFVQSCYTWGWGEKLKL